MKNTMINELNKIHSNDIKLKIEELVKNHGNCEQLSNKELDKVSGGIDDIDFDHVRINGWTYQELYDILCWTYESYYIPGESWDYAKGLTVDVATSFIPSIKWKNYMYLPYPDFIKEPMRRIWFMIPD